MLVRSSLVSLLLVGFFTLLGCGGNGDTSTPIALSNTGKTDAEPQQPGFAEVAAELNTHSVAIAKLTDPQIENEFWGTLATVNYVQQIVNPARHTFLGKMGRPLHETGLKCLQMRSGICGDQAEVCRLLLNEMHIKSRFVSVFNIDRQHGLAHAMLEVYWKDKWRFFDVTWGAFWRNPDGPFDNVMSSEEVAALEDHRHGLVCNESNTWIQQWRANEFKPFAYVTSDRADWVNGGNGTIRITEWQRDGDRLTLNSTKNIPAYIGHYRDEIDGTSGWISYRLIHGLDAADVMIETSSWSGDTLVIEDRRGKRSLPIEKTLHFDSWGDVTVTTESESLVVVERIVISPNRRLP